MRFHLKFFGSIPNPQRPLRGRIGWLLSGLVLTVGLTAMGCERSQDLSESFPQPLTRAAVCAVDGMILVDHPGPKGQLLLKNGETLYYCDLRGFFDAVHSPDLSARIAKRWLQPFDQRAWKSFEDGWAEPDDLIYVLGSRRMGAMGPTIVPFRDQGEADRFAAAEGGRVLTAAALTPKVLDAFRVEVREAMRAGGMPGGKMQGGSMKHGSMPGGVMKDDAMKDDAMKTEPMPKAGHDMKSMKK